MPLVFSSNGTDSDGAARVRMIVTQGDTLSKVMAITDSSGAVVPLTGYVFRASVKNAAGTSLLTFNSSGTGSSTLTVNAASGLITFAQSSTTTAALVPGAYPWDLQWKRPTNIVETIARGVCNIIGEVTV